MKPKVTPYNSTHILDDGSILHIDRVLFPIRVPRHLGRVPPVAPSGQDEKMPTAEAGKLSKI